MSEQRALLRSVVIALQACIALLLSTGCHASHENLAAQAQRESLAPIRPGEPGKAPFWNERAKQFMVAPAFDIASVQGARAYRFTLVGVDGQPHIFEAAEPWAALTPIWAQVPAGTATLRVEALDRAGGAVIALAGTREFHRAAVFNGPYGKPALPYGESASLALASVMHEPFVQSWRQTGQPDARYPLYRYASKIIGSLMSGCALYAQRSPRPPGADEAIEIGCKAADYLIGISAPAGTLLEFFPPTYHGAKPTEREHDNWTMLMTPAEAGEGYLDLYHASGDRKYLDAAGRIGQTYAKLQQADGTWPLKVDNRTGEPIADMQLIPSAVITFLDRLIREERMRELEPALNRAVTWMMDNPVRTFDWQAQFDDAKLRGPYQNLSKHEACEFAAYLIAHARKNSKEIAIARELLRFAEDQFVVWEHPPMLATRAENLRSEHWFTPCSLEQYAMFEPISGSSAFMIVTYVRAWQACGDPLDLAKAQSLANALEKAQQLHGGRYPTRMVPQDLAYWINSTINTARAMELLAKQPHP